MPLVVAIEGNIAAGKSSVCREVADAIKVRIPGISVMVLPEPVDVWQTMSDRDGNVINFLNLFYLDTSKNAMVFQLTTLVSRATQLLEAIKNNSHVDIIIIERSIRSDCEVFAEELRSKLCTTPIEFPTDVTTPATYDSHQVGMVMYDSYYRMLEKIVPVPAAYICIDTNPEVCISRKKIRDRSEEVGVSKEYLATIKARLDTFMHKIENEIVEQNLNQIAVTIDGNQGKQEVLDAVSQKIFDIYKAYTGWQSPKVSEKDARLHLSTLSARM